MSKVKKVSMEALNDARAVALLLATIYFIGFKDLSFILGVIYCLYESRLLK